MAGSRAFVLALAVVVVGCKHEAAATVKIMVGTQGGGGHTGGSAGDEAGGTGGIALGGAPALDPKCGLPAAAFCETFEQGPSALRGRAGDLDPTMYSAGRMAPQLMSGGDAITWVGQATLPSCRAGVQGKVYPPDDTLICNANASIRSAHLLTAVAAQNYGLNSYRIRQPFDFTGRTGTITLDVDATLISGLAGWASIEVTQEPVPTPTFNLYEYGSLPRNAIELQFDFDRCGEGKASVGNALVFRNHVSTSLTHAGGGDPVCFATQSGSLNRVQVRLSQRKVEVFASDFSPDGVTYGELQPIFTSDISLPFERGYVHFSAHNHATIKYGYDDAWIVRWDNIGFDGPKLTNFREYEIADSATPAGMGEQQGMNLGYRLGEMEPSMSTCCPSAPAAPLVFENVDLAGAKKATLSFSSFYLNQNGTFSTYTLRYRFNGGAFVDRVLDPAEVKVLETERQLGAMVQTIDVPLALLQDGTNTLEFATANVPQNYPPSIANIDLVLETD